MFLIIARSVESSVLLSSSPKRSSIMFTNLAQAPWDAVLETVFVLHHVDLYSKLRLALSDGQVDHFHVRCKIIKLVSLTKVLHCSRDIYNCN